MNFSTYSLICLALPPTDAKHLNLLYNPIVLPHPIYKLLVLSGSTNKEHLEDPMMSCHASKSHNCLCHTHLIFLN